MQIPRLIDIYVRPEPGSAEQEVLSINAVPVLPGVYAHAKVEGTRPVLDGRRTLTHLRSGSSILTDIPQEYLADVIAILSDGQWDREIAHLDQAHLRALTEKAVAMLTVHQLSKEREHEIARDFKGVRQPGSGSRWGYKRDVVTTEGVDGLMFEHKGTHPEGRGADKKRLDLKDLEFLRKQAVQEGNTPVYVVEPGYHPGVAIIPRNTLPDLIPSRTLPTAGKKSVLITRALCDELEEDGVHASLTYLGHEYLVISYALLLSLFHEGDI